MRRKEIRIAIVGDTGAGKTLLARSIYQSLYRLVRIEDPEEGVMPLQMLNQNASDADALYANVVRDTQGKSRILAMRQLSADSMNRGLVDSYIEKCDRQRRGLFGKKTAPTGVAHEEELRYLLSATDVVVCHPCITGKNIPLADSLARLSEAFRKWKPRVYLAVTGVDRLVGQEYFPTSNPDGGSKALNNKCTEMYVRMLRDMEFEPYRQHYVPQHNGKRLKPCDAGDLADLRTIVTNAQSALHLFLPLTNSYGRGTWMRPRVFLTAWPVDITYKLYRADSEHPGFFSEWGNMPSACLGSLQLTYTLLSCNELVSSYIDTGNTLFSDIMGAGAVEEASNPN